MNIDRDEAGRRSRSPTRLPAHATLGFVLFLLAGATAGSAQTPAAGAHGADPGVPPALPASWLPSDFVVQPIAWARSGVDIGLGPLFVRRDPPSGSDELSPEADAAFGYRVPVYRMSNGDRGGPALDVGVEGGVVARFALGEGANGLINSDFRVAFPLGADFGAWETSLALVHESSHFGDDYIEQTPGFEQKSSSRNGAEATLIHRTDRRLRLFGAVDYNWAAVNVETVGARLGAAFDASPDGRTDRRIRPIGTIELHVSDYTRGPGITGMVGVGLRAGPSDLRLGLTGHVGPSEMGQFRGIDEEYFGVFLTFVPAVVGRSADGGTGGG